MFAHFFWHPKRTQSRERVTLRGLENGERRFIKLAAAIVAISSVDATAADVRPFIYSGGSLRAIVVEGAIERGDFDTFVRIARENQGQISSVYCFTPGGDFYEAMKIGRAMRALALHSQAPMRDQSGGAVCNHDEIIPGPKDERNCTCASAGFFMHIGAANRGGTFLAVHRPYFQKGAFGDLSQGEAENAFSALQKNAREYMDEMGVPQHVQEDVLGTSSEKALILDEKTVKTYFWGYLPYLHEWIKNRCERLVSKSDELNCKVIAERQLHTDAYTKYFNQAPSDVANHNFTKWSEATKYIGKTFYEIMSEEKFEEDNKYPEFTTLTRSATASSPLIQLFDTAPNRRVVSQVSLLSAPNPSKEFLQKLIKSLENAWGRQSSGNQTTEWRWGEKKFSAELKYWPKMAEGPVLIMTIRQR